MAGETDGKSPRSRGCTYNRAGRRSVHTTQDACRNRTGRRSDHTSQGTGSDHTGKGIGRGCTAHDITHAAYRSPATGKGTGCRRRPQGCRHQSYNYATEKSRRRFRTPRHILN